MRRGIGSDRYGPPALAIKPAVHLRVRVTVCTLCFPGIDGGFHRVDAGLASVRCADTALVGVSAPLDGSHRLGRRRVMVGRWRDHAEVTDGFLQGVD